MKNFLSFLFTLGLALILLGLFFSNQDTIVVFFQTYLSPKREDEEIKVVNSYYRDYDFLLVQNTDQLIPKNYQDLINLLYTALNAGKEEFYFYCTKEYENCMNDVTSILKNQTLLSDINNYVHPFNSFSKLETSYDSFNKIIIEVKKNYTEEEIVLIQNKVDEIFNTYYRDELSLKDNIRKFHDYIIDHAKYDSDRTDKNIIRYKSDIAYGPLFEGYAICGGYTDLMQLFLEKMNIINYRISSNDHIWNAVKLNDKWYHLDLTWDDPVVSDGSDYLEHSYFMIDSKKLYRMGDSQHNFDTNSYLEFKETN